VSSQNLAHGLATPAQPSRERLVDWPVPAAPHGRGHHVVRCTRQHGGEVADGELAAQVPSDLHHRVEGGARVASGKFMAVIAHPGGGAAELARCGGVSSVVRAAAAGNDALQLKEVKGNETGPNNEGGRDRSLDLTEREGFAVASASTPAWGTAVQ
jgi:hypothetical protein